MTGIMKRLSRISELLLAVIFLAGGINGLLLLLGGKALIPVNTGSEFARVLSNTCYILIPQKSAEITGGLLLLAGRFRFMALAALAPLIVAIVMYHVFDDTNILIVLALLTLYILALWGHQRSIGVLLRLN
jgi:uncharacterized membrane protein YphA (DoxX/SURF4 family)